MSIGAARADASRHTASSPALRVTWVVQAIAALAVLVGALVSLSPDPIGVFWDDGVYLLTAKALAAGEGYRYTHIPGAPPAIHYPPGFPLLLAALLKVTPAFPANVTLLKLLNPLLLALGVFGALRWLAPQLHIEAVPAALATVACALIAPVMVLTNVLLSESLFFALLVLALWLSERAVRDGGPRRAAAAGASIAVLALVRTVGGVLLPAAMAAMAWRRRWRDLAVITLAAVLCLAPWQMWVWQAARGFPDELRGLYGPYLGWVIGGYRQTPSLVVDVVTKNVMDLWQAGGIIFAPRMPRVVQGAAALLALLGGAAGLVALLRRAPTIALFFAAYAAVVLLWPYNPERFVYAVWPLAGLILLAAASACAEWWRARWSHAPRVVAMAVSLLLVGQGAYAVRGLASGWGSAPQQAMTRRLWPLVEWSVTHAAPDEVIASDAHVMIALYTGRQGVPVSMLTPAEYVRDKSAAQYGAEMSALVARYHPRLLVLSRGTAEFNGLPTFAGSAASPVVTPLADVPGGGSAFALRARP